jgi:hypothetical protein
MSEQDAVKAKNTAMQLKEKAEQSEKLAITAKIQAEKSKQEAIQAKFIAETQKVYAQQQTQLANNEKTNAEKQTQKAEQQKIKAEQSELKSQKLKLLSIAQNLTLKSSLYKKNKQLMGHLAVQAYIFNKDNGGLPEDAIIYEGLKNAYAALDSNKHSVILNSQLEVRGLTEVNATLVSVDLDGKVFSQNYDNSKSQLVAQINYFSPINTVYFNQQNNYLITAHDNFNVRVWDIKNKINNKISKTNFKEYTGHTGLVRAVAISDNQEFLATSGKDSVVFIWTFNKEKNNLVKKIKISSAIKAIVFANKGSAIIIAQTDGKLIYYDIEKNENKLVYKNTTAKPISVAYNTANNTLLTGLSDGTLLQFNISNTDVNFKYKEYKAHISAIEFIVFNADNTLVATAATDKSIKFYNYQTYFESANSLGSFTEIKDNLSKIKSLIFTTDNKIAASFADKSIRLWETDSQKLVNKICNLLKTNLTDVEWKQNIGEDIPYQKTCNTLP